MFDKIKRVKEIKTIFKESTKNLKEIETIDALNNQIKDLKEEIRKFLNKFPKKTSKNSNTCENLNYFINYNFSLSKKGGEKFTKSLTMWRGGFNKKALLNPMSSIFLAKKEIIAWGKAFDDAVENISKQEKIKQNEENKKKKGQLRQAGNGQNRTKGLSKEEEKELAELLGD